MEQSYEILDIFQFRSYVETEFYVTQGSNRNFFVIFVLRFMISDRIGETSCILYSLSHVLWIKTRRFISFETHRQRNRKSNNPIKN